MRAYVIGAGFVGLQQAVTLQNAGYNVTVLEAADKVGTKASGLHAGLISPTYAIPPKSDCNNPDAARVNFELANRTREALKSQVLPHIRHGGLYKLYHTDPYIAEAKQVANTINSFSDKPQITVSENPQLDYLNPKRTEFHQASWLDTQLHKEYLLNKLKNKSEVLLNASVTNIDIKNNNIIALHINDQDRLDINGAPVVIATGASEKLLLNLGYEPNLKKVRGSGVTFELPKGTLLPTNPIRFEPFRSGSQCGGSFGSTPLRGNYLRIAGGIDTSGDPKIAKQDMLKMLKLVCPDSYGQAKLVDFWQAERPYSIDGMPSIGAMQHIAGNLYLNIGHGGLGLSQSVEAAEVILAAIQNKSHDLQKFLNP